MSKLYLATSEVYPLPAYRRSHYVELLRRLKEPRQVAGPRQVGKTTLVQQVLAALSLPAIYASADEPTLKGPEWVAVQWERQYEVDFVVQAELEAYFAMEAKGS
ncbi:ATP-binding protein [Rhodothermus marinus]|uniref:ATP-binding protein n=1 Tax=Rhodothermus marinus TaxID=29549 RepID=UPI000223DD4F|nr:ATP-binding protein [Rhodothermus marinus]AEN73736.1 hypothetical protein Rhom172_1822 [Rhodothermus marinus SG0.5JP17-172]